MMRIVVAVAAAMLTMPSALAGPLPQPTLGSAPPDALVTAQADCSSAAAREARRTGGRVLAARAVGGACEVTLLVPQPGGRPRRVVVRVSP